MRGSEITEEVSETKEAVNVDTKKKTIFVAGATGSTGKRVVEQLLSKGFSVKAGVRDLGKAKTLLSNDNPSLQIVSSFLFFKILNVFNFDILLKLQWLAINGRFLFFFLDKVKGNLLKNQRVLQLP